jgi:hypothetical protein
MAQIFTTLGMVEESTLVKTEGSTDTETETTQWQEWRRDGVIVKREVQMQLKQGVFMPAEASM